MIYEFIIIAIVTLVLSVLFLFTALAIELLAMLSNYLDRKDEKNDQS